MGITLVNRLRFDATRVELNFSKGVAANIIEAADEIERLTAAPAQQEPVAWQVALNGGHRQTTAYRETADMWREGGAELIPLYAAPPADAKATELVKALEEIAADCEKAGPIVAPLNDSLAAAYDRIARSLRAALAAWRGK